MSNKGRTNGRHPSTPFLSRVRIRNYKSLVNCDVELGTLNVLVGRNGAGKSNFLDALRFISDALQTSLDQAIKSRGGLGEVRHKGEGRPGGFGLQLDLNLDDGAKAVYGFEIGDGGKNSIKVVWEYLKYVHKKTFHYIHRGGQIEFAGVVTPRQAVTYAMPPASPDRLYLGNAASLPVFRGIYDALLSTGFYNLNPTSMRSLQRPDAGAILHRDGGNIASVVGRIAGEKPEVKERVKRYLATAVPGVTDFNRVALGPMETLEFEQAIDGPGPRVRFLADAMSDGTLRALGALVAVTQLADGSVPVRLVGIEEPETALHPAASGALMDALREAAVHTQVVVTTHSPDLLDQLDPDSDRLLVVQVRDGGTEIGPIDPASREAIREHLFSPGDLLRMDQLEADQANLQRQRQMSLFEAAEGPG